MRSEKSVKYDRGKLEMLRNFFIGSFAALFLVGCSFEPDMVYVEPGNKIVGFVRSSGIHYIVTRPMEQNETPICYDIRDVNRFLEETETYLRICETR